MPPPSIINFLAGLFASAGINMMTSVATGPLDTSTAAIAIDAGLWVLAAASATWLAHVVDTANREVDRRVRDDFTVAEEAGVRKSVQQRVAGRLRAATVTTVLAAILGVLSLPNLLPLPW